MDVGSQRNCRGKENPMHLAAEFACAVTAPSSRYVDWVAKNGDESLFQAFKGVMPEVCCCSC